MKIDSQLDEAVLLMAQKYDYEAGHAERVAGTAEQLFQGLRYIHGLPPSYLALLLHACMLHDIGHFIDKKKHHKHSRYLIENDRVLHCYPEGERRLMALVARCHRKQISHRLWELPVHQIKPIMALVCLLRAADGLDFFWASVGHPCDFTVTTGKIVFQLPETPWHEEQVSRLAEKTCCFPRTFGLEAEFRPAKPR